MPHHHPVNHLFLHFALRGFFQLTLTVRARPCPAPLLHARRVRLRTPPYNPEPLEHCALASKEVRGELDGVISHAEVEEPEACVGVLICGGLYDSVNRCFIIPAREELQGVARIDNLIKVPMSWRVIYDEGKSDRTNAFSTCLIHLHFPSRARICSAATD